MLKEISAKEFEKKFGAVYDPSHQVVAYLENGVTLWRTDWNGEEYTLENRDRYRPVAHFDENGDADGNMGYEKV